MFTFFKNAFVQFVEELEYRKDVRTVSNIVTLQDVKPRFSLEPYKAWVDANGNFWNATLFSPVEAAHAAASLLDCNNCNNCTDCTHCIDCTDCTGCINCVNCYKCNDCISCDGCSNLSKEDSMFNFDGALYRSTSPKVTIF